MGTLQPAVENARRASYATRKAVAVPYHAKAVALRQAMRRERQLYEFIVDRLKLRYITQGWQPDPWRIDSCWLMGDLTTQLLGQPCPWFPGLTKGQVTRVAREAHKDVSNAMAVLGGEIPFRAVLRLKPLQLIIPYRALKVTLHARPRLCMVSDNRSGVNTGFLLPSSVLRKIQAGRLVIREAVIVERKVDALTWIKLQRTLGKYQIRASAEVADDGSARVLEVHLRLVRRPRPAGPLPVDGTARPVTAYYAPEHDKLRGCSPAVRKKALRRFEAQRGAIAKARRNGLLHRALTPGTCWELPCNPASGLRLIPNRARPGDLADAGQLTWELLRMTHAPSS